MIRVPVGIARTGARCPLCGLIRLVTAAGVLTRARR
jgi:hypothetical protein